METHMTFWMFFLAGVFNGMLIWIRERLKEGSYAPEPGT
jgi:hypothetical protein